MHKFKIRFNLDELEDYASRYNYIRGDRPKLNTFEMGKSNFLTKEDFLSICEWKTLRTRPLCVTNSNDYIQEITEIALNTKSDQLRVEILMLLKGVSWPTASVILHFCHVLDFPIFDYRALSSLDIVNIKYNYILWKGYTDFTRKLKKDTGLSMRTIDKALWQYSKEN